MGYKVLITATDFDPKAMALLTQRGATVFTAPAYSSEDALAQIAAREQIDAIIVRVGQVSAKVIDASPKLRVVSKDGIGVDNIDVQHATAKGITVTNARYSNSQSVAEHALGMIIGLLKDFIRLDASTRAGNWEKATYYGGELRGRHVGLIGYGGNGRALANLLKPFGVTITVYDPYLCHTADFTGVTRAGGIDDFIGDIDILSIHCPRTKESFGMIGRAQFAKMKSTAFIVNCARGGIIDENALVAALNEKQIAGAALDVFETEPPATDHPLWQFDNVHFSPHIAGVTFEAAEVSGRMAVENIYKILDGEAIDPDCVINPEILPRA